MVILRRLNALKVFFTRTLAKFIHDIIQDPRRIRRYFTVAGVARIVIDLSAAGYYYGQHYDKSYEQYYVTADEPGNVAR